MKTRKERIEAIFGEAIELNSPEQRAVYLAKVCGDDRQTRSEVDELIQAYLKAGHFLTANSDREGAPPKGEPEGATVGAPVTEKPGDRMGRYKLLQQIGEGGCGVVYMAEQEEPVRRRVALKVIKLGMDTKAVIARFEAERQALALMDHPNIAKVLDAGATETGRPYFVMKLVRGIKITDYCDQNNLSTGERLGLFIKVCQAIQHAHQKGVIHRDIKPSNTLVSLHDGVPVPVVIDFGIAKATEQKLTEKTLFTAFEQFIGTPAYTSPEQAEMSRLDIDTRSDIYSLGVLLYELLTGKTPFDTQALLASGLDEMRRTIREQEPVRPSTKLATLQGEELTTTAKRRSSNAPKLIHLLKGDLDWIVMKCLEKDRTRRYETANGLAMDLQRHLSNEPVVARPPSTAYRVQKFVRRNKVMVIAAGAVVLVLVLGVLVSTWLAVQATRARQAEAVQRKSAQDQSQLADGRRRQAEASDLLTRKHLYAADMLLAYQAFEQGNLRLARQLLAEYRPIVPSAGQSAVATEDLRGWEWRHLWQRSAHGDELAILGGKATDSPGGQFLRDGHTVVSLGDAGDIRFWDLNAPTATPERVPIAGGSEAGYWLLTLSPDSHLLALGAANGWALWDTATRRVTHKGGAGLASGLAFSPDGQRLAVSVGGKIAIVDVATGLTSQHIARGKGYEGEWLSGLAFSPDGNTLAYGYASDQIRLHDLASRTEVPLGPTLYWGALSLAYSPDGRFLVSADRGGITVWDATTRSPLRTLKTHRDQVHCVTFSPDGTRMASASGDNSIKLWDTGSWEELATLQGHEGQVHTVAFSPDGERLVSAGDQDRTVRIWPAHPPSRQLEHRGASPPGAVSLRRHARGDRSVLVHGHWKTVSFVDRLTFKESEPETVPESFDPTALVVFGRNAALLAAARTNGPVELWKTRPFRKTRALAQSELPAQALALNDRGDRLAVLRSDQTVEIWNTESQQLADRLPALPGTYPAIGFAAGDRCLARVGWVHDPLIEIWFLPEKVKHEVHYPPNSGLNNMVVSHDGTVLATSAWDGQVRLWDVNTGQLKATFAGQLVGFTSVAFSSDDSRLAAGGFDGSVTLWDLATHPHRQVAQWKVARRSCDWLEFTDGDTALITSGEPTEVEGQWQSVIRRWPAPALSDIDRQPAHASQ